MTSSGLVMIQLCQRTQGMFTINQVCLAKSEKSNQGHNSTVPPCVMLSSNSQAVHVGNFLPRRRATASCTRVDEICTDRPEERNPNCDPTCRPILPGRRVSLIFEKKSKSNKTFPQLPPEVHPPKARRSSHINRTLPWSKTCF